MLLQQDYFCHCSLAPRHEPQELKTSQCVPTRSSNGVIASRLLREFRHYTNTISSSHMPKHVHQKQTHLRQPKL